MEESYVGEEIIKRIQANPTSIYSFTEEEAKEMLAIAVEQITRLERKQSASHLLLPVT
jgi:hypothetical protein